MCRDNRGHNYKELERRDAIKAPIPYRNNVIIVYTVLSV